MSTFLTIAMIYATYRVGKLAISSAIKRRKRKHVDDSQVHADQSYQEAIGPKPLTAGLADHLYHTYGTGDVFKGRSSR